MGNKINQRKALLVIDIQNYFMRNPRARTLPRKVVKYITANRRRFDLIVFTHFVNHKHSNPYKILGWKDCMKSPDIDIVREFGSVLQYGKVFKKSVLSALKIPELNSLLRRRGILGLYLCGIDTDCCVLATAYDAFDDGYDVTVLRNLSVTTGKRSLHKSALEMVERSIGLVK